MGDQPSIHRARLVLVPTSRLALHVHHAGLIYALLASAWGRALGRDAVLPDGIMLDAPDVGRTSVAPGDPFGIGMTIIAEGPDEAADRLRMTVKGLQEHGRAQAIPGQVLSGNFTLSQVEDLVAGKPWEGRTPLRALGLEQIHLEVQRVCDAGEVTLRFGSPLRMMRPRPHRSRGRECFDGEYFDAGLFIFRALRWLHEIGLRSEPTAEERGRACGMAHLP